MDSRRELDIDRLLDGDWREVLKCVARGDFKDGIMPGVDDHRRVSECVADTLEAAAQALRRQPSVEECLSALKPFADAADTRVTDFRSGAGEVFTPADTDIFPAGLITWGDIRKARQIASLYGGGGE